MKKFDNFCNALNNLKDIYEYTEPYGNVELTGMVGLYEVCFEQAWKAMKEILGNHGFAESQTGSPRQILKTAYQAQMIDDEELWIAALVARNNVAHSYNKEIAKNIVSETKEKYYKMFVLLKSQIENYWM